MPNIHINISANQLKALEAVLEVATPGDDDEPTECLLVRQLINKIRKAMEEEFLKGQPKKRGF